MTWLRRYRLRYLLANNLWLPPLLSMLVAIELGRWASVIDAVLGWETKVEPSAAQAVLATLAASMFSLIVFVSSALLVALQLASSQLTPRILGIVFRNVVVRLSLVTFTFAFAYTLTALAHIHETVTTLTTRIATTTCILSMGCFLYLIDHVGKTLRPSGALGVVGRLSRAVIVSVYPRAFQHRTTDDDARGALEQLGPPTQTIVSPTSGTVLAFDRMGLVKLATHANCVIELVPQVGDYLAEGDPLFRVYGGGSRIRAEQLEQSVAVGQERTLEQDPMFGFRIIVDIASKGLSPAINDPTTAVLALDQIQRLLREVGSRDLTDEHVRDVNGELRLLVRTPNWDDFVHLAVTEIRQFGESSIQVARRLRAALEHLLRVLPKERTESLRHELSILSRSSERAFAEDADRQLAGVSDRQGVGGGDERRSVTG